MIRDKNKKLVFGLIGFGCGIILSGIVMIVVVLNTNIYEQEISIQYSEKEQQEIKEQLKAIQTQLAQSTSLNESELTEQQLIQIDQINEKILQDEAAAKELPQDTNAGTIVTVHIPKNATSEKICKILEDAQVISDAKDFENYVKAQKKTKYLKDGKITLPAYGTYEEILELIAIK
ncbi:hypothetical protein [Cellulosilyticum sp. I15G10I2]|uniref:hypothetical protein n=1 Tax=Cellulosilyticum sp. I15G10I2 TaxID=1892843 RepID=UPI00085C43B7|nr:hypothetical protein [Cellulosilyticum sp. I15G10I2]